MGDADLVATLTQGGAVGILALAVVGFLREWIVPGSWYRKALVERDEWKDLSVELMRTTSKAVKLAEPP